MEIKGKVKSFIRENFLFDSLVEIGDDESLLEKGIIDSTGVLELILYLEEEFGIKIEDAEVIPENLDSLSNIEALLKNKTIRDKTNEHYKH
jgi:acyl carrier protein